jgi:hypothetical protein
MTDATSGVGCLAGRLEDNATPNFNRMVGEAFIKPAQQRNIHGGLHAVGPFLSFEQSEEVLVKFVDDFIVTADLRCPFGSRDSTTSLALLPKSTVILPTAAKQSLPRRARSGR